MRAYERAFSKCKRVWGNCQPLRAVSDKRRDERRVHEVPEDSLASAGFCHPNVERHLKRYAMSEHSI